MGAAIYGSIKFLQAKSQQETRVRLVRGRDKEQHNDCVDSTLAPKKALPWKLSLSGLVRSGVTGSDGKLPLRAAIMSVFDALPAEKAAELLLHPGWNIDLRLGDAPALPHSVSVASIPQAWWQAWAGTRAPTLPPGMLLVWDACRALIPDVRTAVECLISPTFKIDGVWGNVTEAQLPAMANGAFGAAFRFSGQEGDRLVYRILVAELSSGWTVEVRDVETNEVVVGSGALRTARHDIDAVLPRTSKYVMTLTAKTSGKYRALRTMTPRSEAK